MTAAAALAPVFLVILAGTLLRALRLLDEAQWRGFDSLVYYVFFPALLVGTLARADFSAAPIGPVAGILFAVTTLGMAGAWAVRPLLSSGAPEEERAFTSFFQGAVRWNSLAAIGIATSLFGREGATLLAVAMVAMIPVLNVGCVAVLAVCAGGGRPGARRLLIELARNPLIVAIAIGLGLWASPVPLPAPAMEAIDIAGRAGLATALISVGAGLRLAALRVPGRFTLAAAAAKLLVLPAAGLASAWALGLGPTAMGAVAIALGVPTAASAYTLARVMGGDAERMATIITVQTLLSALSLPAWLWLAAHLAAP